MKSLKNVLAALAFIFAFGAALATSANSSSLVTVYGKPSSGPCKAGTLIQQQAQCGSVDQGLGQCTVQLTSPSEVKNAFEAGCSTKIFKQF